MKSFVHFGAQAKKRGTAPRLSPRHKAAFFAGSAFLALPAAAHAESDIDTAADASTSLSTFAESDLSDAIVVTASRRRDENSQDVPIALSVVSAESLERRGDYTLTQI